MVDESFVDKFNKMLKSQRAPAWQHSPSLAATVQAGSSRSSRDVPLKLAEISLPALLAEGERGAVWTDFQASWATGPQSLTIGGAPVLNEEAIRSTLVFYDKFDVVQQDMFGFGQPSVDVLQKLGIIQKTMLRYDGSMEKAVQRAPFDGYIALSDREPNKWTISRSAQMLGVPSEELTTDRGVALTIDNALPVFGRSVPLEDVLEFKLKRRDELRALRTSLDELCKRICMSGANDIRNSDEFTRFDSALSDHMIVMQQSNAEKILVSFRASMSWDVAIPAVVEAVLEQTVLSAGVLGGAAVVGINTIKGLKRKKSTYPFEYLTSANRLLR